MALTTQEKVRVRRLVARVAAEKGVPVHWRKQEIGDALDAIDARWDAAGTQSALANDIEAAAPSVFSAAEKSYLLAFWLIARGAREREAI